MRRPFVLLLVLFAEFTSLAAPVDIHESLSGITSREVNGSI